MADSNVAINQTAVEYQVLQIFLREWERNDQDIPEALLDWNASLVRKLIETPAATGVDLALKANVLLEWVEADDLPAKLTLSLCRDTVRVFPIPVEAAEIK